MLVAADHGLSPRGTHGAGEPDARRAPFVMVGPRLAKDVSGLVLPQAVLAPTLALALDLGTLPLAEVPPAVGLLRLPVDAKVTAIEGHLAAKAALARAAGRPALASALDLGRVMLIEGESPETRLARLVAMALDPDLALQEGGARGAVLAALAALLALVILLLARRKPARALLVAVASAVSLLVFGGAGRAVQLALLGADPAGPALARAAIAGGVVLVAVGLALVSRAFRAGLARAGDATPIPALVLCAAALAWILAFRLGIDAAIHTPVLVAGLAVVALLALALSGSRARPPARPFARATLLAAGLLALAGPRIAEGLLGEGALGGAWAGSLTFAGVALAAWAGSALPGPRSRLGIAALALALAVLRTAVWHGVGGLEALGHVDPSGRIVPGAAGVSDPWTSTTTLEAVRLIVTRGLVTGVLVAAALRAIARSRAAAATGSVPAAHAPSDAGSTLLGDLALVSLAQGVALVLGASTWAAWSWWVLVAVPTFLLAIADAGAVLALRARAERVAPPRPPRRRGPRRPHEIAHPIPPAPRRGLIRAAPRRTRGGGPGRGGTIVPSAHADAATPPARLPVDDRPRAAAVRSPLASPPPDRGHRGRPVVFRVVRRVLPALDRVPAGGAGPDPPMRSRPRSKRCRRGQSAHAERYRILLGTILDDGGLSGLDLFHYARSALALNEDLLGPQPREVRTERPWVIRRMFRGAAWVLAALPILSLLLGLHFTFHGLRRARAPVLILAAVLGCAGGALAISWLHVLGEPRRGRADRLRPPRRARRQRGAGVRGPVRRDVPQLVDRLPRRRHHPARPRLDRAVLRGARSPAVIGLPVAGAGRGDGRARRRRPRDPRAPRARGVARQAHARRVARGRRARRSRRGRASRRRCFVGIVDGLRAEAVAGPEASMPRWQGLAVGGRVGHRA